MFVLVNFGLTCCTCVTKTLTIVAPYWVIMLEFHNPKLGIVNHYTGAISSKEHRKSTPTDLLGFLSPYLINLFYSFHSLSFPFLRDADSRKGTLCSALSVAPIHKEKEKKRQSLRTLAYGKSISCNTSWNSPH